MRARCGVVVSDSALDPRPLRFGVCRFTSKNSPPRRRRNIGRAVAGGADLVVTALSVSSGGMEWPAAWGGNKGQREGLCLSLAHG